MARREVKLVFPDRTGELTNPHKSYEVTCHNKAHSGAIGDVTFSGGTAIIRALPDDAEPEEIEDRVALLEYFQNAHYTEVPIEVWNPEKRVMEQNGSRVEPTYVVKELGIAAEGSAGMTPRQRAREAAAAG